MTPQVNVDKTVRGIYKVFETIVVGEYWPSSPVRQSSCGSWEL